MVSLSLTGCRDPHWNMHSGSDVNSRWGKRVTILTVSNRFTCKRFHHRVSVDTKKHCTTYLHGERSEDSNNNVVILAAFCEESELERLRVRLLYPDAVSNEAASCETLYAASRTQSIPPQECPHIFFPSSVRGAGSTPKISTLRLSRSSLLLVELIYQKRKVFSLENDVLWTRLAVTRAANQSHVQPACHIRSSYTPSRFSPISCAICGGSVSASAATVKDDERKEKRLPIQQCAYVSALFHPSSRPTMISPFPTATTPYATPDL